MDLDERIFDVEERIDFLCDSINKYSSDLTRENNLVMLRNYSQELHDTLCVLRYLRQIKSEEKSC